MTTLEVDFADEESFETALPPVAAKKGVIANAVAPRRAEPVDVGAPRAAPDPETYLLACCLLDAADVMPRCEAAGVGRRTFTDRDRGEVYEAMRNVWLSTGDLDVAALAADLKRRKLLDRLGGWDYLVGLTPAVPTTLHAQSIVDGVQREFLRRELLRAAEAAKAGEDPEILVSALTPKPRAERGPDLTARSVLDFQLPPRGHESILVGDRWLNRGDIAILSSTSSMGKSSASLQIAYSWALGRDFLGGLRATRPLKSLIFQSEDGEGDVAEVALSLAHAMKLSVSDLEKIRTNVQIVTDRIHRGPAFIRELKRQIALHKPDIVFINPLLAFIDGDVNDAKEAGAFIRDGLNSLNEPATHAYVILHHTAKPPKDKQERKWSEVMYEMAGSADLTNAARAIIALRSTDKEGEFDLVMAKRGRRAGYTKEVEGAALTFVEPTTTINIRWSKDRMTPEGHQEMPVIHWERFEKAAVEDEPKEKGGRPSKYEFSDFRNIMPAPNSDGLEIGPLHRLCEGNKPITKSTLHNCLDRWAKEGMVEKLEPTGRNMRYRRAM